MAWCVNINDGWPELSICGTWFFQYIPLSPSFFYGAWCTYINYGWPESIGSWYHGRVIVCPNSILQSRLVRWEVSLYINSLWSISLTNVRLKFFPIIMPCPKGYAILWKAEDAPSWTITHARTSSPSFVRSAISTRLSSVRTRVWLGWSISF